VVLGVSGGIAAYKAVEICRRLVDAGAHVMPVLTAGATRFVGPLTFSALASEPARTSLFEGPEPIPHTRLGQDCDRVVVAPARARAGGGPSPGDLAGRRVLVTAGGTREAIDPVRFIGNRSSGKMGYAVAEAAARRGAQVVLVTTVDRPVPAGVTEVVRVESAAEMADAVLGRFGDVDVVV